MANNDNSRIQRGILGDINPEPSTRSRRRSSTDAANEPDTESMVGGSRHDRTEHSGSRDVTEGVSGGTGTEVGGSRNFRQGTGATGTDIGNRPE